jgi:hypothetical protein
MCISQQADDDTNGVREADTAVALVIGPGHLADAVGFDKVGGLLDGEPVAAQVDDVRLLLRPVRSPRLPRDFTLRLPPRLGRPPAPRRSSPRSVAIPTGGPSSSMVMLPFAPNLAGLRHLRQLRTRPERRSPASNRRKSSRSKQLWAMN